MRARDIMSRPVRTVRPDTTIEAAAALLTVHGFAAAPVVDDDGRLVGIVSEIDLLCHRVPADPTARLRRDATARSATRPHRVSDVMTPAVITSGPETDVADIAEQMLDHQIRSVPIVADHEVVGIVSRRDILCAMVRADDLLTAEVQHRLDGHAGGRRRWTATVDDGVVLLDGEFDDDIERQIVMVLARTVPGVADVHSPQRT